MPECIMRIFLKFCLGPWLAPTLYLFNTSALIPVILNGLVKLVDSSDVLLQSHALEDYNSQSTYTSTYN